MSNIERKYAYYDEGILPGEGEYGITYLTLYSSNAGNVYDGWIWDPNRKTVESATPRTFGYRNPKYPDYCWDDEVVVDLSNAQQRQEDSTFEQGRITSFNTNVSDRPIVLQDVDITALTETERESKATVVLFSAIPLINDSYIHAQIEVQCKVNLSPNNTSGVVRVEAFYILNDESDRTMRPNPVHTFAVCTANERHTLPLMYWNPALKHEDHNYIGVKLLATGGTVEIGISDDPRYGDAIITLVSAGLTGDNIFNGKPIELEIFGLEEVVAGYELNIDDYTVLCTYDTGEVYEVTHMCDFDPVMGTEIIDPITILTAYYQGLQASMQIRVGIVTEIELIGPEEAYDEYTFDINDWTVYAYLDNGDVMEVTDKCTYVPEMGTTVTVDTELTASYEPYYQTGSIFTDTATVEIIHDGIITAYGDGGEDGLLYSLYKGNQHEGYYNPNARPNIIITGNADISRDPQTHATNIQWHEYIHIPSEIVTYMRQNGITEFDLTWDAEGTISGIDANVVFNNNDGSLIRRFIGFKDVKIEPYYTRYSGSQIPSVNPIIVNFSLCKHVRSSDLSFLQNIKYDVNVADMPVMVCRGRTNSYDNSKNINMMFYQCETLTNLDFLSNFNVSNHTIFSEMFEGCTNLTDITALRTWDMSSAENIMLMFTDCTSLKSAAGIESWNVRHVKNAGGMFRNTALVTLSGVGSWTDLGIDIEEESVDVRTMFSNTKIYTLAGLNKDFFNEKVNDLTQLFNNCSELKSLDGVYNLDFSNVKKMSYMFKDCVNLSDISSAANWDVSNIESMQGMFYYCSNIRNIEYVNRWNPESCLNFFNMFLTDPNDDGRVTGGGILWNYDNVNYETVLVNMSNPNYYVFTEVQNYWSYDLPTPVGRYYQSMSGMFRGGDVFDLKYHTEGEDHHIVIDHLVFLYIDKIPWWYQTMIQSLITRYGPYVKPSDLQ